MVFSASSIFKLYPGDEFYWWRKPEYPENSIDLLQVTYTLYHIILHQEHLALRGILSHNYRGDRH